MDELSSIEAYELREYMRSLSKAPDTDVVAFIIGNGGSIAAVRQLATVVSDALTLTEQYRTLSL